MNRGYFIVIVLWLIIFILLGLSGCVNPYPTKVYYEIHDRPIPRMKIIINADGSQSIVQAEDGK